MIKRDYYLNKLIENRENGFVKIITGIIRCGKSTLIKKSSKYFDGVFIYYQCLKAVDLINAKGLSLVVKEKLDNVFLLENTTFVEVLDYLLDLYQPQFY